MCDNTYKLLVEVESPLHNVPVVENCDIPLVLYLFQILLLIFLHLYIELDPLATCYTEVPGYTARYYCVPAWYYTVAAQCCMVYAQCYIVAQCFMGLVLG